MQMILYIIAAFLVVAVFLAVLIVWRKRKRKKTVDEQVTSEKITNLINFTSDEKNGSEQSKDSYESIIRQIKQAKKCKSILFASAYTGTLPVTVPVNTAVELTKEKQRCLLIDLDIRRDAVAKVFGLDPEKSRWSSKSIQTEFENLSVWPAHKFTQLKRMNIKEMVEKGLDEDSSEKFDFILINAPALLGNLDRKQIISAAQAAFICAKDTSDREKLEELIESSDCEIIGHIQIN